MDINKIKDSFNRYNSWVKKYENERQEAQKNYTPEAFYKWNSEAGKRLKSTAAAFISELKENSKQELETLKTDSFRKVFMFKALFTRLLGIFIQYTFLKSPSFELSQKVYAKREE